MNEMTERSTGRTDSRDLPERRRACTAAPIVVLCAVLSVATFIGTAARADNLPLGTRVAGAIWVVHPHTGGELRYTLLVQRDEIFTQVSATKFWCRTRGIRRDVEGHPRWELCADGSRARVLANVARAAIPYAGFRFDTLMSTASLRTVVDGHRIQAVWNGRSPYKVPADASDVCNPMIARPASATASFFGGALSTKVLAQGTLEEGVYSGCFFLYT